MMKKRIRLCRAVEPNQGVRALYARRLKALQGAFQRHVLEQILLHLDATGTLAMDLSLSNPKTPAERARLEALRRKVLSSMARANPGRVQEDIDKFVSEHLAEWTGSFTSEARKLCTWLVQSTFTHTTRAQREALHAAGLSRGQMRAKWTVPIVSGQYVSAAAAQAVRGLQTFRANKEKIFQETSLGQAAARARPDKRLSFQLDVPCQMPASGTRLHYCD